MFKEMVENVRNEAPLVHCMTNYVTVNDCSNVLLAAGASPVMADDIEDVKDIVKISSALVINIGTLNSRTVNSMLEAGKIANESGIPVILDPVGAGASNMRLKTSYDLLEKVKFTAIRGNLSEIISISENCFGGKGVDADGEIPEADNILSLSKNFSKKTGAVIAITGQTDYVTDGKTVFIIKNGHPMMSKITGTGCMLTSVAAAFIASNKDKTAACAAAVAAMGVCGERAVLRLKSGDGNVSLRNYIIDEFFNLNSNTLMEGIRYEVR